jgi:type I restriction enzyme M protein
MVRYDYAFKAVMPQKVKSNSETGDSLDDLIQKRIKTTPEQVLVVSPLVRYMCGLGWSLDQMMFGKREWRVPKNPSEASKREKNESYDGFPCDIAIFDSLDHNRNPRHLLVLIECKQLDEKVGVEQLETYLAREPHVKLGVWANDPVPSAPAVFLYRKPDGSFLRKRRLVADLPRPGEKISAKTQKLVYNDLQLPTTETFKRAIEDLLDRIVMTDSNVTRREDQLDQLCNLLLLKLDSDKRAKVEVSEPPTFRPLESANQTAREVRKRFASFVKVYPEVFTTDKDREIRLNDETINSVTTVRL